MESSAKAGAAIVATGTAAAAACLRLKAAPAAALVVDTTADKLIKRGQKRETIRYTIPMAYLFKIF
jgi:hypothetical protein